MTVPFHDAISSRSISVEDCSISQELGFTKWFAKLNAHSGVTGTTDEALWETRPDVSVDDSAGRDSAKFTKIGMRKGSDS